MNIRPSYSTIRAEQARVRILSQTALHYTNPGSPEVLVRASRLHQKHQKPVSETSTSRVHTSSMLLPSLLKPGMVLKWISKDEHQLRFRDLGV